MRLALVLLLLAAPLSAQDPPPPTSQTTLVAPIENIINVGPTPFEINIQPPMSDSVMLERLTENVILLRMQLAQEQEQEQGAGTTERVLKTVGWWVLGIIAVKQLYNIANREPDVTNINVTHEDGDIHVTVPPHEHPDRKRKRDHDDDDSEGGGH